MNCVLNAFAFALVFAICTQSKNFVHCQFYSLVSAIAQFTLAPMKYTELQLVEAVWEIVLGRKVADVSLDYAVREPALRKAYACYKERLGAT